MFLAIIMRVPQKIRRASLFLKGFKGINWILLNSGIHMAVLVSCGFIWGSKRPESCIRYIRMDMYILCTLNLCGFMFSLSYMFSLLQPVSFVGFFPPYCNTISAFCRYNPSAPISPNREQSMENPWIILWPSSPPPHQFLTLYKTSLLCRRTMSYWKRKCKIRWNTGIFSSFEQKIRLMESKFCNIIALKPDEKQSGSQTKIMTVTAATRSSFFKLWETIWLKLLKSWPVLKKWIVEMSGNVVVGKKQKHEKSRCR